MSFLRPSTRAQPAWAALLAAFALLAQGLWPASAMPMEGGLKVQMCTPQGLQDQPGPAHDGGPAADCCGLCVLAAAVALPAVQPPSVTVRYIQGAPIYDAAARQPSPRARGPPRPPSQAPPPQQV